MMVKLALPGKVGIAALRIVLPLMLMGWPGWAAESASVRNQDFEGSERWGVWPPESPTWTYLDTTVAHAGKQSLCIVAPHPGYRGIINTPVTGFESETLYRVGFHVRKEPRIPASAIGFFSNLGAGKVKAKVSLMKLTREPDGEWTRWSGEFYTPKDTTSWQFCLVVDYTQGRVWLDDVRIEPVRHSAELDRDVWTYWLPGSKVGSAGYNAFVSHQKANDAIYQMAGRYNSLLMAAAQAERAVRDVERCHAYAGQTGSASVRRELEACEDHLQEAYAAYGRAFKTNDEATREEFAIAAAAVAEAIAGLEGECGRQMERIRPPAAVRLPAHLGRQDPGIPPFGQSGRMNRLLFGAWSPPPWSEFEEPFELEFHSSVGVRPAKHTETETDFGNVTRTCDDLAALGYRGSFSMLYGFGIGGAIYAPRWLLDKHQADPDFMMSSQDGSHAATTANRLDLYGLNMFHPAVQAYVKDFLSRYAAFCRHEPRVLFYEVSHEATMTFGTGGPAALNAFHAYLSGKYGTIAALNQAWGTDHASFTAIGPPPDYRAEPRRGEVTPLIAEFEAFRDEAFVAYLKLVYDSIKQGDPTKPVAARHASLLLDINGARLFEACDVISFHYEAPWMQLMNLYLNTLNRYAGKGLGYLEDFWGLQEERFRVGEEVASRRGLEKHIARAGIWGRTLQMKWYAYTDANYLGEYNGNWFDPRYEGTTMRYCAPALAVAKRKLEMVDWVLTHSQIVPARVAIVQPSATMRNGRPLLGTLPDGDRMKHLPSGRMRQPDVNAVHEIMGLHRLLYPRGILYELVPEEYFETGRARPGDFAVVILPQAADLSEGLQERLAGFLAGGGTLVACGQPGRHNAIGRPCQVLARAMGETTDPARWSVLESVWTPSSAREKVEGKRFVAAVPCGKGKLIACAGVGHLGGGSAQDELLTLIADGAERQAWSEGNRFEVVLRLAEDGGRYLFLLNPDADNAAGDTVQIARPVKAAVDVTIPGGFPVSVKRMGTGSALDVRLGAGETAVIYLNE